MKTKVTIGTAISGTNNQIEIIEALSHELKRISSNKNDTNLAIEACKVIENEKNEGYLSCIICRLIDTLNYYAPDYTYFGTQEGNGSDFGFWIDDGLLALAIRDGDVIEVNNLAELTNMEIDKREPVLIVGDQGKMTYGIYNADAGEFTSIWSND